MEDELSDWELALLVESRKYEDPRVVEATAEEAYRDHKDLIEAATDHEDPVVVERQDAQNFEAAEDLREQADGVDDPVVVERETFEANQEAVEAVESVLGEALTDQVGLREGVVDAMSAPQMVEQFRDEDSEGVSLEALSQHPETGGDPAGDDGNVDPDTGNDGAGGDDPESPEDAIEALSAEDRQTVREKVQTYDRMQDRTPDYAESLSTEVEDLTGFEADEIVEVL